MTAKMKKPAEGFQRISKQFGKIAVVLIGEEKNLKNGVPIRQGPNKWMGTSKIKMEVK